MADTEQSILALAERLATAIEIGDVEAVRACYTDDVSIWHNFDNLDQTWNQNLPTLRWMLAVLSDRKINVQRRVAFESGYLQQHVLTGRRPNGEAFAMPACVVATVREGRIARLEEYLDLTPTRTLAAD
jgi:ketosteroid isomerase-like protein